MAFYIYVSATIKHGAIVRGGGKKNQQTIKTMSNL
jgi:hypothetical protein